MLEPTTTVKDASHPPAHSLVSLQTRGRRWLLLLLFIPLTVFAMALFRLCVFSDVKGRVVLNGQPVAGAVVERRYSRGGVDEDRMDKVITDANGYFKFDKIWHYSPFAWLPFEANVHQNMWIKYANKEYEAWRLTKHQPLEPDSELPNVAEGVNFDPNTPYNFNIDYPKRKILLMCDLAQSPSWKEPWFGDNQLFGICYVVENL